MRLALPKFWLTSTTGICVMLGGGLLFAPGIAHAGCGDYVMIRSDSSNHSPGHTTSGSTDSESNSEQPDDSNSPVPPSSPCPGAGCGPVESPPVTATATTSTELQNWLCAFAMTTALPAEKCGAISVFVSLPTSRQSEPLTPPPRPAVS